ncbi:MAG TPA: hypothetical protein VH583_24275 [Vicinamibacterales bacterium]|jgi:hypothetical protein
MLLTRPSPALFFGRAAAHCAHPYAAWRVRRRPTRIAIVSAYAAVAYLVVLSVLLMF